MSEIKFRILGLCGSLQHASYNRALLQATRELLPDKVGLDIYEGLAELPHYNDDLCEAGEPEPVSRLKAAIRECNVLLVATPEYNYGIPGALKNAIDWASTPADNSPLKGKPVGIMGASVSRFGTVRAQLSLRQTFLYTDSLVMARPEMLISNAAELFDAEHKLIDPATRDRLHHFVISLIVWSRKFKNQ